MIGYGAGAVNPYLVAETFEGLAREQMLLDPQGTPLELDQAVTNYARAVDAGLLKIFSKMGISTLLSYRGAQVFEAIGLSRAVIDEYFPGTPSRIEGIGLEIIAREALQRVEVAYPGTPGPELPQLDGGGEVMWRRRGEHHMWNPETIQKLQHALKKAETSQLQGVCRRLQRREPAALHLARTAGDQGRPQTDSPGDRRAGQGDRQAVLHRRHELRQHQQGSP